MGFKVQKSGAHGFSGLKVQVSSCKPKNSKTPTRKNC